LEWGSIAESICDLENAILLNNEWDPLSLQSQAQHRVPNKIILKDDIPFRIGRDLIVDIPVDLRGTVNLYINSFCGLTVDINDNAARFERAPLLAIVSAAQEVVEIEPLCHNDIEARPKLIAEAGLTEIKKNPRMANRLLLDDNRSPRQQIPCLLNFNFRDVKTGMYIKRRAGNEHRTVGPPWTNHSYRPPFPQQTAFSQAKSREQAADHNQRTVQRGSTFLTFRAR